MSKAIIKLNDESVAMLKSQASIIDTGDKKYYFLPYWFEETETPGTYVAHYLDKPLPPDLVSAIEKFRQ